MGRINYSRIEEDTTGLIEKFKLLSLPIDVYKLSRELGIEVTSHEFENGISGVLVMKSNKATIGYNSNESPERQRFSIAHELGHFHYHTNSSNLFVDNINILFRSETGGNKRQEIEANAFAAGLLMPRKLIEEKINEYSENQAIKSEDELLQKLASDFKVSLSAMSFRLLNLGLSLL